MQSRPYQFWVSAEGIAREVITADIQRYLGPDALVRPGRGAGENEDQDGFWITAHTTLTRQMLQDLKADSQRWRQEAGQQRHGIRGFEYQDSRTHAARQQYGPSPPPSVPPSIATTALGSFSPQPQQNFEQRGTFAGRASLSQDTKPASPSQDYYTASDGRRYPIPTQSPFGQSAAPRQGQNAISKDSETSTPSPGYYIASDGRQYPVAKQPSQSQHSRQPESAPPKQTSSRPGYYLASDGREYPLLQASTQRQAPAPSQETKSTATPGYYVASDGRQYPLAQQPGYSQSQANYQTQTTVPKPSSPTSFTSAYYTASDGRQYPRSQQPQQSGYGLRSPLPNTSGFGGGAGAGGGADSDDDVKKVSDKRRRRSSRDYDM